MRRSVSIVAAAVACGVFAVACGGGSSSNATPTTSRARPSTAAQPVTVRAVEGAGDPNTAWKFEPAQITVHAGDTISFANTGKETQTVTADDGSFDLGTVNPGEAKTHIFAQAGTFAYHCSLHPWMKGTVVVTGG